MAEWTAVGVSVAALVLTLLKHYGADARRNGRQDARMDNIERELERGFRYDGEHFQHAKDDQVHIQDQEMHWTSRERDELSKQLDNIHKAITTLGERMYGK